jgi:DNA end-binding protein Ku
MAARAIFKAVIQLAEREVPVKFYAAVEGRGVPFRLLHEEDGEPVVQELIDKTTEEPVARDEVTKAYPLDEKKWVVLDADDLASLAPKPSRTIEISHFVAPSAVEPVWYERPYYLGPDGDDESYFALAAALEQRGVEGIARWVMRGRVYLGALRVEDGYLMMSTMRPRQEVIDLEGFARPPAKELTEAEIRLARQLIETLEGGFDPSEFHDDFEDQVRELVEQKALGRVIPLRIAKAKKAKEANVADALKKSLAALKKDPNSRKAARG